MAISASRDLVVAKYGDSPLSGRRREQEVLGRLLASKRAEFLALYGRRRVGKTVLVRRFFHNRARLFEVTGQFGGSARDNLRVFAEALSETFHGGAGLAVPPNWHKAFRALRREIETWRGRQKNSKKKWVIFLDELPWLATQRSGCIEELEHFWNSWCSQHPDIILIACGSAASWMLKNIVDARGGLHNRLTETIRLLPFSLSETRSFLADRGLRLTEFETLELYMAVGGVPHYLERVPQGVSMAQAIDALCFHRDGPLASEFDRLYSSLFADAKSYLRIVETLAKSHHGVSRQDLLRKVSLRSGGSANRILTNLEEAGFIRTCIPFGRSKRDRFYRLLDQFTLFHLRWMKSRRPVAGPFWTAMRGRPAWNTWSGLAFESVCFEHLSQIERALGIHGVLTEASSWQHRGGESGSRGAQIDLLIDRADGVISVCEVKHTVEAFVINKSYAHDLRRRLATFRSVTKTKKSLQLVFVATAGVADNAWSRELVDRVVGLEDLLRDG